jgi:hypothetical protein
MNSGHSLSNSRMKNHVVHQAGSRHTPLLALLRWPLLTATGLPLKANMKDIQT